ncbi:MAG: ECF transporter S component [Clostridiales bacterium]|jgi:riboflavin transporter FmnP|nr:ECF transporter S component [Clostridiales bacterium]
MENTQPILTEKRGFDVKTWVTLGMLAAVAYLVMVVGRIPMVLFLRYDPKDVIITIGGFLYGPFAALIVSLVVSLVEMFTVSDTGFIGFIMNVLSTCSFACTAAVLYKRRQSLKGAVAGLAAGVLLTTCVMLVWNYLITPLYMKVDREQVAALLIPAFLPFNLVKGGLNAAITLLLYKPVVTGLRKARLVPQSQSQQGGLNKTVYIVYTLALATFILLALSLMGII